MIIIKNEASCSRWNNIFSTRFPLRARLPVQAFCLAVCLFPRTESELFSDSAGFRANDNETLGWQAFLKYVPTLCTIIILYGVAHAADYMYTVHLSTQFEWKLEILPFHTFNRSIRKQCSKAGMSLRTVISSSFRPLRALLHFPSLAPTWGSARTTYSLHVHNLSLVPSRWRFCAEYARLRPREIV